ncbi:MAG: SET domain-containing protein-lysine N-methyltransferase [Nitrospirae bacterium]|nr:SET domain-containing protein-lysine N-methyltransferase [Nitrospirota bacterium]
MQQDRHYQFVGVSAVTKNIQQKFSWLNPNLEVRSAGGGDYKSMFARMATKAGERLVIFGGEVFPVVEQIGDYGIQIDEDFVINGVSVHSGDYYEDTFFFNHSCEPNAGIKGQIFLVAMRDIAVDEEVTFDYAMCLHETKGAPPYRMECLCGRTNCRKVITDNDYKIKELQKKYDGYFSWYLQDKIDRLKKRNATRNGSKQS